jgi:hypothetical protein
LRQRVSVLLTTGIHQDDVRHVDDGTSGLPAIPLVGESVCAWERFGALGEVRRHREHAYRQYAEVRMKAQIRNGARKVMRCHSRDQDFTEGAGVGLGVGVVFAEKKAISDVVITVVAS